MGLGMFGGRYDDQVEMEPYKAPDYIVRKRLYLNGYTIVKVWYRAATNCYGNKILVMNGCLDDPSKGQVADPHFADSGGPVARFHPSQDGWDNAIRFVETL